MSGRKAQQASRDNGVQKKVEENHQKMPRLRPAPPALAEYIRLVNDLPGIPRPKDLLGADVNGRLPLQEGWDRDLRVLLHKYPSFQEFLTGALRGAVEPFQVCDELKKIRMMLYMIVRHQAGRPLCPAGGEPSLDGLITVQTDPDGILRILYNPLLGALEGVEAKRVRECPRCGAIYWAGRIDQPACTAKCTHALRQDRYRKNYRKNYRENYLLKYKVRRYQRAEEQSRNQPPTDTKK
jgi:hypothetical protein